MGESRWAWAEVDHGAIRHNVELLRSRVAPSALWAVVKADGYGHGSVATARTAVRAGAEGLAVALVEEGVELRRAGIDAAILVLSEQPFAQVPSLVEYRLTPTVYTTSYADAVADAVVSMEGPSARYPVHVKVDTGMQRVGVQPDTAPALVDHLHGLAPALHVAGVFTHLACADDPDPTSSSMQLAVFDGVLARLDAADQRL